MGMAGASAGGNFLYANLALAIAVFLLLSSLSGNTSGEENQTENQTMNVTPSATTTPSPEPTPSAAPSPSAGTTASPTSSTIPTPSIEPSASPGASASPSMDASPTQTPSEIPSPSPSVETSPSPSAIPSPSVSAPISANSFSRTLDCPKCGEHKAPPDTDVSIAISLDLGENHFGNATLSDYFPEEWVIVDAAGGRISASSGGMRKISWNYETAFGALFKSYILRSPERQLPPLKYDFQSEFFDGSSSILADPYFIIVADPVAQPGDANELRVQLCQGMDGSAQSSFDGACDGTYPSNSCTNDLVDCDDGNSETHSANTLLAEPWLGVKVTTYNNTIQDCGRITNVSVCFEWWRNNANSQNCDISADNASGTWTPIVETCPGTTADPGMYCANVFANKSWSCEHFFKSLGGQRAQIKSEAQATSSTTVIHTWDALFFNVTYDVAACETLTSSKRYYADITSKFTCFNITTSGVQLDCTGHTILGNTSGFGVNITDANNVVIKNCVFQNFSRGISAENAVNLTLINNTVINASNYGIYVNNSARSSITLETLRDSKPLEVTSGAGTNFYAIYLQNFSFGLLDQIYVFRSNGGNTSANGQRGGVAYGIYLNGTSNTNFSRMRIDSLEGGKARTTSGSGAGGMGGNATALQLNGSSHNIFSNLTLLAIIGTVGSGGQGVLGNGGAGGFAAGIDAFSSQNNTFRNITMDNLTGANGGTPTSSRPGGAGGGAISVYLLSSANNTFANVTISNLTGASGKNGGTGVSTTAGAGGRGGDAIAFWLQAEASNNLVSQAYIASLQGGPGGDGGGSTDEAGGAGGKGGDAFAFWFQATSGNNTISRSNVSSLAGGNGGNGGSSINAGGGAGGSGGNGSFFYSALSNNNSLSSAFLNSSSGGTGGAGGSGGTTNGANGAGGFGTGIFLSSSNYSLIEGIDAGAISGGSGTAPYANRTAGINFFGSSLSEVHNSSFTVLYTTTPISYTVFSEGASTANIFLNSTFNRSANGWAGSTGSNNLTIKWFVRANITDSAGNGVAGAYLNTYNATSSTTPLSSLYSASTGLTIWQTLSELDANGSFSYDSGYCTPQTTTFCYGPHNFSIAADGYKPNSTSVNITLSQTLRVHFLANSAPTHNAPAFSPSPPETESTLLCLNQSSSDADGDAFFNIYSFRFNSSGGFADATALLYLPFDADVTYGPKVHDYSPRNVSLYRGTGSASPAWKRHSDPIHGSSVMGGGAYYFDGGDSLTISLSEAPHLNLTGNFTLTAWFNATDFGADQRILSSKPAITNNNGILLYVNTTAGDGHIACDIGNGTGFTQVLFRSPNSQWANKSVFVACTYNTTSAVLYVNDSEVNRTNLPSAVLATAVSTSNFSIGREGGEAANYFTGMIDDVRIYNHTLTSQQLLLLYQQRSNATAAAELAASMNASCCTTPTDTYATGVSKCVSETVITPAAAISFTVFSLGNGGANFTTSIATLPGNFTEGYYFNTSNPFAQLLGPCGNPDGATDCQSGMDRPAYRIRNTGNANTTLWMNISASLSSANIKLCANSTVPSGCPTGAVSACDLSGEGNLNASAWLKIASNLGQNSVCFDVNVTIYANFSNVAVGTPVVRSLVINSTLT